MFSSFYSISLKETSAIGLVRWCSLSDPDTKTQTFIITDVTSPPYSS